MSTLDPKNNDDYAHNPFDEDYESAKKNLGLEKQFALMGIVSKIEKMDKSQLLSYSKALTAQKMWMEQTYNLLMKDSI